MSRRKIIAILGALLVLAVVGLGAAEVLSGNNPFASGGPTGYAVRILDGDDVLASFDLDDLEEIGYETITVLGKKETGPRLSRVLEAAGVEDYDSLSIRGAAVRDDGIIVLTREEAENDVLLDIANRGTVKIVGPDIAWEDRVRDVLDIVVEGAREGAGQSRTRNPC